MKRPIGYGKCSSHNQIPDFISRRNKQEGGHEMSTEVQSTPKRIQRRRTKGWRMPEGAVYVGRPTIFGNPYRVLLVEGRWTVRDDNDVDYEPWANTQASARRRAVDLFGEIEVNIGLLSDRGGDPATLSGRDLACWCPLDQPCHADILLEIANGDGK